jgi:thioredoxin-like negative regulator of GroEL
MNASRLLLVGFVVAVVGVAAVSSVTLVLDERYSSHGGMRWATDVNSARETAAETDRPVLVYFWQDRCSGCQAFDERLSERRALRDTVERFVLASANVNTDTGWSLAQRYNVSTTPTLLVVAPDGDRVAAVRPASADDVAASLDRAYERWRAEHES